MKSKIKNNDKSLFPPENAVSQNKRDFKAWAYKNRTYFLCFIIPMVIMYIAYAVFKVHPYGDNSVLVLDLNGQYVYYYEQMRDAFWGNASSIFSWDRNLSGNMFGIYAYYLMSPFMLIICILPRTMMCGAIEIVQLLKIATAGLTFAIFINKTYKPKRSILVSFSILYALMSYMVVELLDFMWLDGLIFLPLICLGVARLVDQKKILNLAIPLALMFITHFYIGYMVGIFTFMYFVYYVIARNNKFDIKNAIYSLFRFCAATAVSLMTAAFVLIPVYKALSLGKLEFSQADFSLRSQFSISDFITKLFPMTYDTVNVQGLPMIFCGTLTLILVPLFFMNKRIATKVKVGLGSLTTALILIMYLAPLDLAMHGFQQPNWLNYRYSFVFSFVLLIMAVETFTKLDGVKWKAVGGTVLGLFMLLFYYEKNGVDWFTTVSGVSSETGETTSTSIQGIWFAAIMIAIYFVVIYLFKHKNSKFLGIALVGIVSIEMYAVSYDTLKKIDKDVAYSKYTSYEPYMQDMRDIVNNIETTDDSFYRMEKTFYRTVCDPMGMGYAGVSHSSSTMLTDALLFLKNLGFGYRGNATSYNGSTYLNDSLLNIKYLVGKDSNLWGSFAGTKIENIPTLYTKVKDFTVKENGDDKKVTQYKNPYSLSIGFQADSSIDDFRLEEYNPFENQNNIYNNILGNSENIAYLNRLEYEETGKVNLEQQQFDDKHKRVFNTANEGDESHIDYVVTMDRDGPLYMFLPTDYERESNVWYYDEGEYQSYLKSNSGSEPAMNYGGAYFEGDNYRILNLGEFTKDQRIRIRISIKSEALWTDELFYTLDQTAFENAINEIKQNELDVTEFTDRSLKGNITISGQNKVMETTIPYEEGWNVTVDGKSVRYNKSMDAMISIPLSEGDHKIEMTFMPKYFILSIIISIIGFLLLVLLFLLEYKNGKLMSKLTKGKYKVKTIGDMTTIAKSDDKIDIEIDETEIEIDLDKDNQEDTQEDKSQDK